MDRRRSPAKTKSGFFFLHENLTRRRLNSIFLQVSILHHTSLSRASPPLSYELLSPFRCLSSVSFRLLLCMLSDSRSISRPLCLARPGVAAEITTARPVCIEQSLSSSGVLRKTQCKTIIYNNTARRRERASERRGAGAHSCKRMGV